jgi:hypothetical protein
VNREAARRLVPPASLATLVRQANDGGEPVSAARVAAEFTVTDELAAVALALVATD